MKEQNKAMVRDLSETALSNMPARQSKATIIKILPGLEKRIEDISENLTTEIKELTKNQSEMKGTIISRKHA